MQSLDLKHAGEVDPAASSRPAGIYQLGPSGGARIIVKTWMAAGWKSGRSTRLPSGRLVDFDAWWDELFPAEQARIVQCLLSGRLDTMASLSRSGRTTAELVSMLRTGQSLRGPLSAVASTAVELSQDGNALTVRVTLALRRRGVARS